MGAVRALNGQTPEELSANKNRILSATSSPVHSIDIVQIFRMPEESAPTLVATLCRPGGDRASNHRDLEAT